MSAKLTAEYLKELAAGLRDAGHHDAFDDWTHITRPAADALEQLAQPKTCATCRHADADDAGFLECRHPDNPVDVFLSPDDVACWGCTLWEAKPTSEEQS